MHKQINMNRGKSELRDCGNDMTSAKCNLFGGMQKSLAKGMILRICPSEGYKFENLPWRRVCYCRSDPVTRKLFDFFTENHQN